MSTINESVKKALAEVGLNEEQVSKLEAEGVIEESDVALLSSAQIKEITGCGVVTAAKVANRFAPKPVPATVSVEEEIPEGKPASPEQVASFAAQLGLDSNMLSMFMLTGAMGGAGEGMDVSGMIPISQVVAGYNPKIRNMFLMVMGQFEARLGCPLVVINEDGSVNKPLTVEYIEGLEEGREQAENNVYFGEGGQAYEVIAVGVDAQSIYDADPINSTKALQKSGMGTGRVNWSGTNLEVKQTAFYAVQTGEISPESEADLDWLREKISPDTKRLVFSSKAPKAVAAFNEARRTGSLPTLRVMLSRAPRRRELMPRRRSSPAGIGSSKEL